jgi:hypothetical protein
VLSDDAATGCHLEPPRPHNNDNHKEYNTTTTKTTTKTTRVRWAPGGWWPQVLSSDRTTWYNITKPATGGLVCTCTGNNMYRGKCRHVSEAAEFLESLLAHGVRIGPLTDPRPGPSK